MFPILFALVLVAGTAAGFATFVVEFGWLVSATVFGLWAALTLWEIYKVNHAGIPRRPRTQRPARRPALAVRAFAA